MHPNSLKNLTYRCPKGTIPWNKGMKFQRKEKQVKCPNCLNNFITADIVGNDRKFCSKKCYCEYKSKTMKGIRPKNNCQFKKGQVPYNKGVKYTKERLLQMSITAKRLGFKPPLRKGCKLSEELKHRLSLAHKGIPKPEGFGDHMRRNKHWKWIEDRSLLKGGEGCEEKRSSKYKEWRRRCCMRDGWKCKIANSDCKGRLEVHHILGFTEHPELRYDINNGITLCHAHHPRKRAEEKRLSPYFKDLVSVSKELI